MTDKEAPRPVHILGDDPFADMGDLEWLGVAPQPAQAAPPQPAPETVEPPPGALPALDLPDDDAERALREWLREETPPEASPAGAKPVPDTQAQLLARLLAEQESARGRSPKAPDCVQTSESPDCNPAGANKKASAA